jgi:hypothetical protein
MAVEIKSGATSDIATVDITSKALRVTQYDSSGAEILPSTPTAVAVANVTAAGNDLIASFDASVYKYISFQTTGTWVGTVEFQESNDNGTWTTIVVQDIADLIDPYKTEITENTLVKAQILGRYVRVRCTAYTSGTLEGVCDAYKQVNDTGQISSTGTMFIAAGQQVGLDSPVEIAAGQTVALDAGTEEIGVVGLAAGSSVAIVAGPTPLQTDFTLGAGGSVNANDKTLRVGACILRAMVFTNYAATARHVKVYNSVANAAGTNVPVIVCSLPAGGTLAYPIPSEGLVFSVGISICMTLGAANADVTATATAPDFSLTSIFT